LCGGEGGGEVEGEGGFAGGGVAGEEGEFSEGDVGAPEPVERGGGDLGEGGGVVRHGGSFRLLRLRRVRDDVMATKDTKTATAVIPNVMLTYWAAEAFPESV
jgi:hypothetical protein